MAEPDVIGKTTCPCGSGWIGTIAHGMREQRSHAEFHASAGPGLGAGHDPGLASFVPDRVPDGPKTHAGKRLAAELGVQYRIDLVTEAESEARQQEREALAERIERMDPLTVNAVTVLAILRDPRETGG